MIAFDFCILRGHRRICSSVINVGKNSHQTEKFIWFTWAENGCGREFCFFFTYWYIMQNLLQNASLKQNKQTKKKSSFLMKFSVLNVLPYSIFFWYYEWFAKLCCPLLVYGWHDMSSAVYSWKSSFLFLWSVVSNYILHFMLKCIIIYLLFASNALLKSCVVAFLLFLLNLFSVEVPCLNLFLGCKVVDDI